ncbi:T9SS type A sorting domain-containing protein [Emticicia sp. BO119]|uniref:T9SS type A sorting domain-containing protein n=1 Tax=Emticicia sp. BO119 TaxID=2757768 RepID=UPI0015F0CC5C|nr:T9SS type A sorting domain-containing protein [Emticicia sp. BO119]MBA4850060.1 T9SS type A sorting domain-containing protein [Emticicia sp. BO119]
MRLIILLLLFNLIFCNLSGQTIPAFPGAEGFGASTTGGRGGQVIYVTNLNCSGTGSLAAALQVVGKKYILFKVSGVIPCAAEVFQGDVYIAGQTSPGGIIVRGIVLDEIYETNTNSKNIIIRHLRSRPKLGTNLPNQGYVLDDALRLDGASNVIVDHCSFANAIDEAVQISNSHNITVQNCQLAETLGEHYSLGGMLLNYSEAGHEQDNISIHHNVWNRIGGRMPEFSCESPFCHNKTLNFEVSNNLFWDQQIQTWYNPCTTGGDGCRDFHLNLNFVDNRTVARNSYTGPLASADLLGNANNHLFASGNTMNLYPTLSDYQLFYCCNDFNTSAPNTDLGIATRLSARHNFPSIAYTVSNQLVNYAIENVGAFPRDPMDRRLMNPLKNNVIDSNPINGTDYYNDAFQTDTSQSVPIDSDNDGMPNDWETANGLNPNVQDHNGLQLSKKFTGVEGYTNLECYLNELSDKVVGKKNIVIDPGGGTTITGLELNADERISVTISPNPAEAGITIKLNGDLASDWRFEMIDSIGRVLTQENNINESTKSFYLPRLIPNGIYFIRIYVQEGILEKKIVVIK